MTTPGHYPGPEEDVQQIGSDWGQDTTEETVKQWARDQVSPGFGGAWIGQFDLFNMIIGGIFNGWFGTGSVGDPLEVEYTVEAIRQAVLNGWVVDTVPFSSSYEVPQCTELKAILIGGGQSGQNGGADRESNGGLGGGFLVEELDAEALQGEVLSVVIGQANQASIVYKVGDPLTELVRCDSGSVGGIAVGVEGYTPTTSAPGSGGRGGRGSKWDGSSRTPPTGSSPGTGSARGAGGAAGELGTPGTRGQAGGNVSAGASVKCGGGGGGAGGAGNPTVIAQSYEGGPGGPGGYPGGGGGGGGGAAYWIFNGWGVHGAGGIGATGCAWFLWK